MPRPLRSAICVVCGGSFQSRRPEVIYCSKSCIWQATKGAEFNARIGREYADKIGDAQRHRGEGKAYVKRRGRHEHRVVAERKIGRSLLPGEIVHHIDGDKLNNHPDNLAVMTQAEHMRKHGLGIPGITPAHQPWKYRGAR